MVNGHFFCIFANETLKNNEYEEISVHFRPFLPVGNGTNLPGTNGAAVRPTSHLFRRIAADW